MKAQPHYEWSSNGGGDPKRNLAIIQDKKFSSCIRASMQARLDENQTKLTDFV